MTRAGLFEQRRIKLGKKIINGFSIKLLSKNLILFVGGRGYVMCGYLNLKTAEKFNEAAVKIVGVSSLKQALKTKVFSCTHQAKNLGIYNGQPIKEALKIIA